jgi:hypothetical protein
MLHSSIDSSHLVSLHVEQTAVDCVSDDESRDEGFFLLADTKDAAEGLLFDLFNFY